MSQSVQAWQTKAQKIQSEFQQLGQDLQAGNLTQAQSDFSSLSSNLSSPRQSSSLTQAFSSLGSALQSGNLSSAQQAYSTVQQDVQQAGHGHHHHHAQSGAESSNSSSGSSLTQLFGSLGSALISGNLSAAQTAYSTLTQGIAGLGGSSGASSIAGVLSFLG
jgi:outer membrane protein assembly factor BamD (BamD/ComL family)